MSSLIYPEVDFSINAIPQLCYENVIYSLHSIKGPRQPSKGELVVVSFGDGKEKNPQIFPLNERAAGVKTKYRAQTISSRICFFSAKLIVSRINLIDPSRSLHPPNAQHVRIYLCPLVDLIKRHNSLSTVQTNFNEHFK